MFLKFSFAQNCGVPRGVFSVRPREDSVSFADRTSRRGGVRSRSVGRSGRCVAAAFRVQLDGRGLGLLREEIRNIR